jgi:HD-like signal output (HDOD) protein
MSVTTATAIRLEKQLRARVDSLAYLPTTVGVAMKFIQLGKDPEAEVSDYVTAISSDSSLSTKLLAMANSSWFGVRNKVTRVQVAVNLLGLGTVRTMAISYCLTGLHNELRLTPDESRMFWMASLIKGVAARQIAKLHNEKLGEEAFAIGLFQDFALPVMYSLEREKLLAMLQNASLTGAARLLSERELFRLDHAEVGRMVAQKLELPELFVDSVAFHHDSANLQAFMENKALAIAGQVAALFPHHLDCWNPADAQALRALLESQDKPIDAKPFLESVQKEFNSLYAYFEPNGKPEMNLSELLEIALREVADNTTRLVGTVNELLQHAVKTGMSVPTTPPPKSSAA